MTEHTAMIGDVEVTISNETKPKRVPEPPRPVRYVYFSNSGKPFNAGKNHAKRVARAADKRDQLAVLKEMGPGLPRQRAHHQELVQQRHRYYRGT